MKPTHYLSAFLLALCGFTVTACLDDDDALMGEAEMNLDFRAEWDGEELAILSRSYDYGDSNLVNLQLFQYYVSDLALLPADGSAAIPLSDVELIRYNSALGSNVATRSFVVPAGEYRGLSFGLGVSPALNAVDPNNFAANDPLNENEFWNATARYVFAKIEANTDLDADPDLESNLTLHMGSDALYRPITLTQNFTVRGDATDRRMTVVADVFAALAGGATPYDITDPALQRVHGGNQAAATGVYDRLAASIRLEER